MEEDSKGEEENEPVKPITMFKSGRERSVSPVRPLRDVKTTPGSIGKLKISSEMRAKLELVTIAHSAKPTAGPAETNGRGEVVGVRKLEDNRRLMLQQQLGGRKWDTVEEVERITRRASSEDRSDLIKAIHQRSPVCFFFVSLLVFEIPTNRKCSICFHSPRPIKLRGLVVAATSLRRTRDLHSSRRPSSDPHLRQPPTIQCSKYWDLFLQQFQSHFQIVYCHFSANLMEFRCLPDWNRARWVLSLTTRNRARRPSMTNWQQEPWRASTPSCTAL